MKHNEYSMNRFEHHDAVAFVKNQIVQWLRTKKCGIKEVLSKKLNMK